MSLIAKAVEAAIAKMKEEGVDPNEGEVIIRFNDGYIIFNVTEASNGEKEMDIRVVYSDEIRVDLDIFEYEEES